MAQDSLTHVNSGETEGLACQESLVKHKADSNAIPSKYYGWVSWDSK